MAAQEVVLRFKGDPAQIKTVISDVRTSYGRMITEITNQTKAEARAAESLQRQRSSALIRIWNAQERERVRLARQAEREIQRAAEETARNRRAMFAGAVGGVTALVGVSAVSEIRQAASAWLDYSSKLESTKIAFTTMLGSAQLAEQHLKDLQQFALTTPFQFGELIDASQRMQALGFNAQQVIPILTDVGNAVAAAGGGSERLDRVVLALSQIQSKGKVATQEMNQLAESGISGWKILEDQLGKTRAELVKMVEAGEISSQTFLDAFQKFSQQNFGGLMEAQSKTFTGAMSNIKDALLQTSATAFAPLYERISETARELAKLSTNSKEFQENLTTAGRQVLQVWDGAVEVFHVVRDAIGLVGAVAVQIFGGITHVILATVEAARGFYFGLQAIARFMAGDFRGAFELANKSTQATENAANELTQALRTQGAVAEQVVRIYENAEARKANAAIDAARKIASAQLGPPPDIDIRTHLGAGIFRQATPGIPRVGGGGGARAERVSEGQRLLNQLSDEYARVLAQLNPLTKTQEIEQELLAGKYRATAPALRDLIIAKAQEIEVAKQEIAANKALQDSWHQTALEVNRQLSARTSLEAEITSELQQQRDALNALQFGEKTHLQAVEEYIVKAAEEAKAVGGVTDKMRELFAELIKIALKLDEIAASEAWKKLGEKIGFPKPEDIEEAPEEDGGWGDSLDEMESRMESFHEASQKYVVGAFHGMADAATSAIEAWILYGGSLGKALKQALAAELAHVAAQAAVQAALHAAFALGKLAFGDAAGAAKHGVAALKFLAVAALTGVAARGLAGSAAASSGGAATANSAFQSATRVGSGSTAPTTTDVNRRATAEPQTLTRTLEFKVKGDAVVEKFVEDYNFNGRTRIIIRSDGQG